MSSEKAYIFFITILYLYKIELRSNTLTKHHSDYFAQMHCSALSIADGEYFTLQRGSHNRDTFYLYSKFIVVNVKEMAYFAEIVEAVNKQFNVNVVVFNVKDDVITIYVHIRFGRELNDVEDVATSIIQVVAANVKCHGFVRPPSEDGKEPGKMWYPTSFKFTLSDDGKCVRITDSKSHAYIPQGYKTVFGKIPPKFWNYFQLPPPKCNVSE